MVFFGMLKKKSASPYLSKPSLKIILSLLTFLDLNLSIGRMKKVTPLLL